MGSSFTRDIVGRDANKLLYREKSVEPVVTQYELVITVNRAVPPAFHEKSVSEISRQVGKSIQTMTKHLNRLRQGGIVTQLPNGNWVANRLDSSTAFPIT